MRKVIQRLLTQRWRDERGNGTIEWVLFAAAAAGLGLAVTGAVGAGADQKMGEIDEAVTITTAF